MLHDDLGLLGQVCEVQRHEPRDSRLGARFVVLGVVADGLLDLPVRLVSGVVRQHIKDESLLDRLAHRVQVKRYVPHPVGSLLPLAEQLESLSLRGSGEREERDVLLLTFTEQNSSRSFESSCERSPDRVSHYAGAATSRRLKVLGRES